MLEDDDPQEDEDLLEEDDNPQEDEDRPVWGADAISRLINRTKRQTFHLLSIGALPARKVGGGWVSTPRLLKAMPLPDAQAEAQRHQRRGA